MSTFSVLADPSRRRIMDCLLLGPQSVNVMVDDVGMSQPVVSKHLRILREAGLVSVTPDGQRRLYKIEAAPLQEVDKWVSQYRQFWSARLDALEAHLDS